MIFYRFCGRHCEHEAHWIYTGARNVAGSGDYYCIGWSYSNAFDEVRKAS